MGMSPDQDPPKFHLISVPIIQCKPPTARVPYREYIGGLGEPDRAVKFTRLLHQDPAESAFHKPPSSFEIDRSDEKRCHSSYPTIPQQCIDHAQALLATQDSTTLNTQYFNTIPLKSGPQRRRADPSTMDYREQPPPSTAPAPPRLLGPTSYNLFHEPQVPFIPNSATDIHPQPELATGNSFLNESDHLGIDSHQTMHRIDYTSETKGCKFEQLPVSSSFGPKNGATMVTDSGPDRTQSVTTTNFGPHWMEEYINELFHRKQLLMDSLLSAEISLKTLLCEESAITGTPQGTIAVERTNHRSGSHASLTETNGSAGRGLHDGESRPSSLMNRLKWRQSRRSKSAHERLPTEHNSTTGNDALFGLAHPSLRRVVLDTESPRQHIELDGSITVMRPNEDRIDTTVPKRLLRWWRQNKRRSAVDTKRRQSIGFMSMHCPESVTGLPRTELRTRGSSMPPNESRSNAAADREPFGERTSNRASLRLRNTTINDLRPAQIPIGYSTVDPQICAKQFYREMPFTSPLTMQFPSYKYIQLYTPNAQYNQSGVKFSDTTALPPNQRIQFIPYHQLTSNGIQPSQRNVSCSTTAFNSTAFFPQVQPGEGTVRIYPGMPNEPTRVPVSSHEFHTLGNNTPNRWTTVRCRPICPPICNDRYSSPPPLPPRLAGAGISGDTSHGIVLGSGRQQMLHSRTVHNVDWSHSGPGDGPIIMNKSQNERDKCITRRELHNANGLAQMSIKTVTQFQPIHNRQLVGQQGTQRQTTQTISSNPNAIKRRGVLLNPNCSRIMNGYEICPQSVVLGSRRVQSATVRTSNWNQGQVSNNTAMADSTFHGRPSDRNAHMDDILIRPKSHNGFGHTNNGRIRAFDNPLTQPNGQHVSADIGLPTSRSGVITIDDCHAALRECLRGWELTGQTTSNPNTQIDFSRLGKVDSISWFHNPYDGSHATANSQWTRMNFGYGHRLHSGKCLQQTNGSTGNPDAYRAIEKRHQ